MAKKELTRNDGRPFNVRKVNGQWMFIPEVFGKSSTVVPRELLIVPESLIPASAYSDGTTAYIPEDRIGAYLSSPQFLRSAERFTTSFTPSAPGMRGGDSRVKGFNPADVISDAKNFLGTFDSSSRSQVYRDVENKTNVTEAVKPKAPQDAQIMMSSPFAAKNPWHYIATVTQLAKQDAAQAKYVSTGDGKVLDGKDKETAFIILADKSGRLIPGTGSLTDDWSGGTKTEADFARILASLSGDKANQILSMFNMPKTGSISPEQREYILAVAREASYKNFTMAETNQVAGRKPYTLQSYVAEMKKSGGLGGGAKTTTSVDRQIASFSEEQGMALLDRFYKENIGRAPTAKEAKAFTTLLNEEAKKRPNVSTTTATTTDTTRTSTTTSKPGFGADEAQMMAKRQAQQLPGATGFLASTKYMDVIMDMIRNPLGV